MYHPDVFYDTRELSFNVKKNILLEAKELCYDYRVDKLDCSISWARQAVDMSFEEIMKKLSDGSHYVLIHRRGEEYTPDKHEMWKWHLEFGFSTMTGISYYLFIYLDEKHLQYFIEKYNIKPMP